jgi:hypothetical protein
MTLAASGSGSVRQLTSEIIMLTGWSRTCIEC